MSTAMSAPMTPLTEEIVMNGFHSFLKNALAQAKAERLLDEETLSSAEADLMVAGPALCLYFAALRSSTTPPSIPIPRAGLPRDTPPLILNAATNPPGFDGFFRVWSLAVPQIKALPSDQQHDLARIICNHEPLTPASVTHQTLQKIAADLRAVAIEISQRRTFQERYAMDLQAALDHGRPMSPDGRRTPSPFRATFVPPPVYNEKGSGSGATSPISPGRSSPNSAVSPTSPTGLYIANPDHDINRITGMLGPLPTDRSTDRSTNRSTNRSTYRSSSPVPQRSVPPLPPRGHSRVQSAGGFLQPPITTSTSTSSSPSCSTMPLHRPSSPTILTAADPAINVIRETLYASLADVISRTPSIRPVIKSDPPRAYFASLGLAILDFSMYSLTPEGNVKAVLGAELKLEDCPPGYRPFMLELSGISQKVKEMATEDDDKAMEILTEDSEAVLPEPRIDHVKRMLERGIGRENDELTDSAPEVGGGRSTTARRRSTRSRSRSTDGSAVRLSNRINTLALNMMKLEAFRERQHDVFKVLAGAR